MQAEPRFREMVLEDGERVGRLRGGRGVPGWKSNRPHWGHWGNGTDYVLVPSSQPRRRARIALAQFPGLTDRSSDAEVLLLGPPEVIRALILRGPLWCRALLKREVSEEERQKLRERGAQFAFKPRETQNAAPAQNTPSESKNRGES